MEHPVWPPGGKEFTAARKLARNRTGTSVTHAGKRSLLAWREEGAV